MLQKGAEVPGASQEGKLGKVVLRFYGPGEPSSPVPKEITGQKKSRGLFEASSNKDLMFGHFWRAHAPWWLAPNSKPWVFLETTAGSSQMFSPKALGQWGSMGPFAVPAFTGCGWHCGLDPQRVLARIETPQEVLLLWVFFGTLGDCYTIKFFFFFFFEK